MRDKMLPMFKNPERVIKIMKAGFMYAYRRDKSMRPVWIINMRKMYDLGYTDDDCMVAQ